MENTTCPDHSPWGDAARDALMLAAVSVAVMAVCLYIPPKAAFIGTILSLGKLVASIWILTFFIRRYASRFDVIGSGHCLRYGMKTSLLSSVICAGFQLLSITVLKPGNVAEVFDMFMESAGDKLPQEGIDAMYGMLDKLPQAVFLYSLISYWLIGIIVSAVAASAYKKNNIF